MTNTQDIRDLGKMSKTRNPRILIGNYGRGNWRTVCQDDSGEWAITGPPYATKLEAMTMIAEVEKVWFS